MPRLPSSARRCISRLTEQFLKEQFLPKSQAHGEEGQQEATKNCAYMQTHTQSNLLTFSDILLKYLVFPVPYMYVLIFFTGRAEVYL